MNDVCTVVGANIFQGTACVPVHESRFTTSTEWSHVVSILVTVCLSVYVFCAVVVTYGQYIGALLKPATHELSLSTDSVGTPDTRTDIVSHK